MVGGVMLFAVSRGGRQLFEVLTLLAFIASAASGIFLTSDSLRSEKREGTLGLLFLTDLRGYDIVLAKLASTSLSTFLALFALFPVFSLGWLLGGVTAPEFWRTCLSLTVTLLFSLSIGLAFSAQGKRHGEGLMVTSVTLVLFTVGWPLVSQWLTAMPRWAPLAAFFDVNPWTCFIRSRDTGVAVNAQLYWNTIWGTLLWSAVAIAYASWVLPRRWMDDVSGSPGWWSTLINSNPGPAPARRVLVYSLLSRNPVAALQGRAPVVVASAWAIVIVCSMGSILQAVYSQLGLIQFPLFTVGGAGAVLMLFVWQSCGFFREAKSSGLLELLATTPITDSAILQGQWIALLRLFAGPFFILLATGWICSFIQNPGSHAWLLWGVLTIDLPLNAMVAAWAGAWFSLNDDRRQLSFLKTVAMILLPKALCFCPLMEPFIMLGMFFYVRQRFVLGIRRILIGPRQMGERSWRPMIEE
ncbi:MAG TPA: hypothetical protein VMF06_05665, partial [Candidatus Limnocylindria bacterium]|nr:hypothetical protein [Candidatus Limnocylindria bacterium]